MSKEQLDEQQLLRREIESLNSISNTYFGLNLSQVSVFVAVVIAVGIYSGVLLFGTNSVEVLLDIENYEENLISEVQRLKSENSLLQKEYFELIELDPDK